MCKAICNIVKKLKLIVIFDKPVHLKECRCKVAYWKISLFTLFLGLFTVSTWFFIAKADPLSIGKKTLMLSNELFYQWTAFLNVDDSWERITVILLTDHDLRQLDETWPPKYFLHREILDKALKNKPKAVAVDLKFIDPNRYDETLANLQKTVEKYSADIPIFFAAEKFVNKSHIENICFDINIRNDIFKTVEGRSNGFLDELAESGGKAAYVPPLDISGQAIDYPLVDCDWYKAQFTKRSEALLSKFKLASIGLAMFSESSEASKINSKKIIEAACQSKKANEMKIDWIMLPKGRKVATPVSCTVQEKLVRQRILSSINYFVNSNLGFTSGDNNSPIIDTCTPFNTLTADEFLSANDNDLKELINGKLVFYGANIDGIPDYVYPPTHERLPGVYQHAMATYNLLNYGNNYIREKGYIDYRSMIEFLIISLIYIIGKTAIKFYDGLKISRLKRHFINCRNNSANFFTVIKLLVIIGILLYVFVSLAIILFAIPYVVFYHFNIPPPDFIGMMGFISMHFIIRSYFFLNSNFNCR